MPSAPSLSSPTDVRPLHVITGLFTLAGTLSILDLLRELHSGNLDLLPAGVVFLGVAYGLYHRRPYGRTGALVIAVLFGHLVPLGLGVAYLMGGSSLDVRLLGASVPPFSPTAIATSLFVATGTIGVATWTTYVLTREEVKDEFH